MKIHMKVYSLPKFQNFLSVENFIRFPAKKNDTRECSLSNQIHTRREKFEELKDIHRNIILLSPWIFEDSLERVDNGNIKMIPQLIAFDECPKSISLISDAPV